MILESDRFDIWIDNSNTYRVYDKQIRMFVLSTDSMSKVLEYLNLSSIIFNRIITND